jgi:hypothetical protein
LRIRAWLDATSYEGKDTILRVVRNEADILFELAEQALTSASLLR